MPVAAVVEAAIGDGHDSTGAGGGGATTGGGVGAVGAGALLQDATPSSATEAIKARESTEQSILHLSRAAESTDDRSSLNQRPQ
jgi:hypothetical protein